jgi:hypothetical protein
MTSSRSLDLLFLSFLDTSVSVNFARSSSIHATKFRTITHASRNIKSKECLQVTWILMGRFRERARNGLSIRTKWTVTEIDTHATVHFANACRYRTYHRDPIRARRRIIRSKKRQFEWYMQANMFIEQNLPRLCCHKHEPKPHIHHFE